MHTAVPCAGSKAKKSDVVKVIPLSRANNVSIMLTQFSSFRKGSAGIRQAVFTGKGLGIERLGLLLQASSCSNIHRTFEEEGLCPQTVIW